MGCARLSCVVEPRGKDSGAIEWEHATLIPDDERPHQAPGHDCACGLYGMHEPTEPEDPTIPNQKQAKLRLQRSEEPVRSSARH